MNTLLQRYAPSSLLTCMVVAAITFTLGLGSTAVFLVGVGVYKAGRYLDNYGLESHP